MGPAGCGFFINTYLVMLSVYINIWTILLLALTTPSYMVPDPDNPTEMVGGRVGACLHSGAMAAAAALVARWR